MNKISLGEFSGVVFWVVVVAVTGTAGSWLGAHGWAVVPPSSFGTAGEWTAGAAALGAIQAIRIEARKNDEARDTERIERQKAEQLGRIRYVAQQALEPSGEWDRKLARLDEEFKSAVTLANVAHLAETVANTDLAALRLPKNSRFNPQPDSPTLAVAIAAELRRRIGHVVDELAHTPGDSLPEPEAGDLFEMYAEVEKQAILADQVDKFGAAIRDLESRRSGLEVRFIDAAATVGKAMDASKAVLRHPPDHVRQATIDDAMSACKAYVLADPQSGPLLDPTIRALNALVNEWMDG